MGGVSQVRKARDGHDEHDVVVAVAASANSLVESPGSSTRARDVSGAVGLFARAAVGRIVSTGVEIHV